jgi:hypothetical protein
VKNRLTNVLLIILITMVAFLTVLRIFDRAELDRNLQEAIKSIEAKYPKDGYTPIIGVDYSNGKDGYTPVLGRDYFNGKNGKDSVSTHTKEVIIKEVPVNGLTPELRCNLDKNRWEVRYRQEDIFEVVNGEPIKCTVTKDDILEVLKEVL